MKVEIAELREYLKPHIRFMNDMRADWGTGVVMFHMLDEDLAWDLKADLRHFNKMKGEPWEEVVQVGSTVGIKVKEENLPPLLGEEL